MAWMDPRYLRHQAQRFIRHDWERYMRPDWRDRRYWVGEPPDNPFGLPNAEPARKAAPAPSAEEIEAAERERLALQYQLAKLRTELELLRFELSGQKAFNPNQPRVPKGNPDGGEWTRDGGEVGTGAPFGARTRLADAGGPTGSDVLSDALPDNWQSGAEYAQNESAKERFLNRHILENHVGKTDDELKERIRKEQISGLFVSTGRDRNGSFDSVESARNLIQRTLDNNPDVVARVVSGRSAREFVTWRFGYETGREAYMEAPDSVIRIRKTYEVGVVIARDPSSEYGYRTVTAYPRNYNPRIGR